MNDYINNGDTTELFGRHPLYVKPSTVARFRPRYLNYALTEEEVANAIRDGRITPAVETAFVNPKRVEWERKYRAKKKLQVDSATMSEGAVALSGVETADK